MFGDTLLESSAAARQRKRWPMATAFTVETIVAATLVIVPLLSTGVIPVSARPPLYTPMQPITVDTAKPIPTTRPAGPSSSASRPMAVILVSNNPNAIYLGQSVATTTDPNEATPPNVNIGSGGLPDDLARENGGGNNVRPGTRPIISVLSEAQLINRVEPVYPKIAVVSGVQGQVKLHAIIARDGRIISLNVISGHPLLVRAAEDAVSRWRYRPYYLNGEAVEVETFITVNFRREGR
jgi:protein TonB